MDSARKKLQGRISRTGHHYKHNKKMERGPRQRRGKDERTRWAVEYLRAKLAEEGTERIEGRRRCGERTDKSRQRREEANKKDHIESAAEADRRKR